MAEKAKKLSVRFIRTHFPEASKDNPHPDPFTIGQVADLDEAHAKALASYNIIEVLAVAAAESRLPARAPVDALVTRIEQLLPGFDKGEAEAVAELEKIRDDEIANGEKPRAGVVKALKAAKITFPEPE